MKNILILATLSVAFLCPFRAYSQDRPRAVELGLGGSAINHTRTVVSNFHQTASGNYVFSLEQKQFYGGVNLYSAFELKDWLYLDLQGTFGSATYYDAGERKRGFSFMAGPGVQFRPFTWSEWVSPFLRLGVNYYRKNFPTCYFGRFEGDVTKESEWRAEDAWNKGFTFDTRSYVPLTAGVGLVGWLGDRIGVKIEGDYMRSLGVKGANFAMGTAGLVYRIGGKSKRPLTEPARVVEKVVEKEVVREVPVEKVKEVVKEIVKEVPFEKTLAELMDNVTFDFDKADITPGSEAVLDEVAKVILMFPESRFLICGHTDAKGDERYNERLSEARAKAVRDALVERGVPESMLCHRGFGKRAALVPRDADDELRRGDRKVVIEPVTWEPLWKYLKNND
ncbi:MAG: OmpA family protein [Bacteroidales bacterium]|nr:OmpA family protein [Bacteroidales bacterium]